MPLSEKWLLNFETSYSNRDEGILTNYVMEREQSIQNDLSMQGKTK
jgi:hypothetical protein